MVILVCAKEEKLRYLFETMQIQPTVIIRIPLLCISFGVEQPLFRNNLNYEYKIIFKLLKCTFTIVGYVSNGSFTFVKDGLGFRS